MTQGIQYGVVSDHETLTKIELCQRLNTNMRSLERRLEELDIVPFAAGTGSPQISGYVYNLAIRQECMKLRMAKQNNHAEKETES
jgi:hypothetical protein